MELHKKILLGSFISIAMVSCNTTNDNIEKTPKDQTTSNANMSADIKVCKDVYLPGEGYISGTASKGAVITNKKWPKGSVITVSFMGGSANVRTKVQQYAQEWSKYANITFKFLTIGTGQIRISFKDQGSYSNIGTDALQRLSFQETMNFGWLEKPDTTEEDFRGTTIHEFGHALGMIHEHQNPVASIPWNKPRVYADLGGPPNNWDKATVDNNMFAKYSTTQTQYSAYDPKSIMHYSFPKEWTTNGTSVGFNSVLSTTDKEFIAKVYPK